MSKNYKLLNPAEPQHNAVKKVGIETKIQWHFAEKEPADLFRKLIKKRDYNIEVIVTPP